MSVTVFCAKCGTALPSESPSGEAAQRKPCPNCQSTARRFDATVTVHLAVSGTAEADVVTYPENLLAIADGLINDGLYSLAVVTSHMACEVAVSRGLDRAYGILNIGTLQDAVNDLLPGYNLANEKVRNLYVAATGRQVQNEAYWNQFKPSATLRNQIIHHGRIATELEARSSLAACTSVVAFVQQ